MVSVGQDRLDYRASAIFVLLATFTALSTYKLHEPHLIRFADNYHAIIDFTGPAPDQYRILPYLMIKTLMYCLDFNYATLLFNFLCFVPLYWLLHCRILVALPPRTRYAVLIVFALIYPVAMIRGYRPVTVFLILLVTQVVATYQRLPRVALRSYEMMSLSFYLCLISFTRTDIAFLTALFLCLYLGNRLPLLVRGSYLAIPVLSQFLLSRVIFTDAEWSHVFFTFFLNISSWKYLGIRYLGLSSPLVYLVLLAALAFPESSRSLARFFLTRHRRVLLLLGAYMLLLLFVGRPREFRLFLPFTPMFLMVLNDFYEYRSAETRDRKSMTPNPG